MAKRNVFTVDKCVMCGEIIEQKARGRPRVTCSDACKQAQHRSRQGKPRKRFKRLGKLIKKRRSRPFVERSFAKDYQEPIHTLSERRWVYECMACGQTYLVERHKSGAPIPGYCSDACEQKSRYHWTKFEVALTKASMTGRIDPGVWDRLDYMKLSPLCPRCDRPFAPNTTLHGDRKPGRPRKYCSDRCCKEAYEHRWKVKTKRARVHRNHECVECGTLFDRTDGIGRRYLRFCSRTCNRRFHDRAKYARDVAKSKGRRAIKGHRAATMSSAKNRRKGSEGIVIQVSASRDEAPMMGLGQAFRNEIAGVSSGGGLHF